VIFISFFVATFCHFEKKHFEKGILCCNFPIFWEKFVRQKMKISKKTFARKTPQMQA
jgi:hypothetical protein